MIGIIIKNCPLGSLTLVLSALSQPSLKLRHHHHHPPYRLFPAPIISTVKILLAQRSSHLDIFFTLSVQMFAHQKQWMSCYSVSCFEFFLLQGKKRRGAQRPPNGLYTPCFTLGCVVYVLCEKSMQ